MDLGRRTNSFGLQDEENPKRNKIGERGLRKVIPPSWPVEKASSLGQSDIKIP